MALSVPPAHPETERPTLRRTDTREEKPGFKINLAVRDGDH
jgi:hypothetical protein